MIQLSEVTKTLLAQSSRFPVKMMAVAVGSGNFIIEPWLGLIGLSVLIITGAIAVVREIRIEEEENNS